MKEPSRCCQGVSTHRNMGGNGRNHWLVLSFLSLLGCGVAEGGPGIPALSRSTQEVKVVTSAVPGLPTYRPGEEHTGFARIDCASCHGSFHNSGFRPADCAGCHGPNGAPPRPREHYLYDCSACHSDSHPGERMNPPQDCAVCHTMPTSPGVCLEVGAYDTIVIGAGSAGLSAAAALARAGQKVLVLEQSLRVGGALADFQRGDFRFELSGHLFDGLDPLAGIHRNLLGDLGLAGKVRPVRLGPFLHRVMNAGSGFDIPADLGSFQAQMIARFPAEQQNLAKLFAEIRQLGQLGDRLNGSGKGLFDYPTGLWPWEILRLKNAARQGFGKFLGESLGDPRAVDGMAERLAFWGGGPEEPSALSGAVFFFNHHAGGLYALAGGSQSLVSALAEVVRENRGDFKLGARATRIVLDQGLASEVRTEQGGCYRTRHVVSETGAWNTLLDLIGQDSLPRDFVTKLGATRPGVSALVLYLGVSHDYSDVFGQTHELLIPPRRGFQDAWPAIRDCALERMGWSVLNYTRVRPSSAPPGKNALILTALTDPRCFDGWGMAQGVDAYRQTQERIVLHFLEQLSTLLPHLTRHLEVLDVDTPVTLTRRSMNPAGVFLGWSSPSEQGPDLGSALSTPIPNVFLARGWNSPAQGPSANLASGLAAARTILGQ